MLVTEDRRMCEPKVKRTSTLGERLTPEVSAGGWCATVRGVLGTEFGAVLDRARRGDDASFACLWRDVQPALLRYFHVVAPSDDEDLAADTWVRVSQGLTRFDGDELGFRAWVFTIARHRALDHRRRAARSRTVPVPVERFDQDRAPDDPAADAVALLPTDAALLLISALPAEQAEVVMLRVVAGLDVARVARIVGKRPGSVRVLAHRGLRRLAELMADERSRDGRLAGW